MPSCSAFRLMLAVGVVATTTAALGPFQDLPAQLGVSDKVAHFATAYMLTALGFLAMPRMRRSDWSLLLVLAGGAIELVQGMMGRDSSPYDFLADVLGIVAVHMPSHIEALRQAFRYGEDASGDRTINAALRPAERRGAGRKATANPKRIARPPVRASTAKSPAVREERPV